MEKNIRENIYMYKLSHFAVQPKLSTTLQINYASVQLKISAQSNLKHVLST